MRLSRSEAATEKRQCGGWTRGARPSDSRSARESRGSRSGGPWFRDEARNGRSGNVEASGPSRSSPPGGHGFICHREDERLRRRDVGVAEPLVGCRQGLVRRVFRHLRLPTMRRFGGGRASFAIPGTGGRAGAVARAARPCPARPESRTGARTGPQRQGVAEARKRAGDRRFDGTVRDLFIITTLIRYIKNDMETSLELVTFVLGRIVCSGENSDGGKCLPVHRRLGGRSAEVPVSGVFRARLSKPESNTGHWKTARDRVCRRRLA